MYLNNESRLIGNLYLTEVTKKDILAGFDANANMIKKAKEYTDMAMALRKQFNDVNRQYPNNKVVSNGDGTFDYILVKKNDDTQVKNAKDIQQKMVSQFQNIVEPPFENKDLFFVYLNNLIFGHDFYHNFDNDHIALVEMPWEKDRARETLDLLFLSALKYKDIGDYFFNNLEKIDRKYNVGHDPEELGEPEDNEEVNEATKKDIMAGLDYLKKMSHIPVFYTWWSIDDLPENGKQIRHPETATRITLDQAVRLIYQTEEAQEIVRDGLSNDVLSAHYNTPYAGVPSGVLLKLYNYLKDNDGVAVFAEPHTGSFYVLGLTQEATEEETENAFYQTIEDIEDLKADFRKHVTDLDDLQDNEPEDEG